MRGVQSILELNPDLLRTSLLQIALACVARMWLAVPALLPARGSCEAWCGLPFNGNRVYTAKVMPTAEAVCAPGMSGAPVQRLPERDAVSHTRTSPTTWLSRTIPSNIAPAETGEGGRSAFRSAAASSSRRPGEASRRRGLIRRRMTAQPTVA